MTSLRLLLSPALVAGLLACASAPLWAQSLDDVARQPSALPSTAQAAVNSLRATRPAPDGLLVQERFGPEPATRRPASSKRGQAA